jgi:hypothetical protein
MRTLVMLLFLASATLAGDRWPGISSIASTSSA